MEIITGLFRYSYRFQKMLEVLRENNHHDGTAHKAKVFEDSMR
jgi:hypothetical protein